MEQASWPTLLPEISFLLNSVSNASTKLSPHLLSCKYEGPLTILRRVGENAMFSLPGRDKWVHLNRCKFYERSQLVSTIWGLLTKGISSEAEETDCNEEDVTQEQDGEIS